jgi:hypothetical protein
MAGYETGRPDLRKKLNHSPHGRSMPKHTSKPKSGRKRFVGMPQPAGWRSENASGKGGKELAHNAPVRRAASKARGK